MLKYLPALAWILALYAGTAVTAGQAFVPSVAQNASDEQIRMAWFWFDLQHIALHAAAYGVLAGLLVLPDRGRFKREPIPILASFLLGLLAVGLGQEALQAAIRWEIRLVDSMGDLASNLAGAALPLGVVLADRQ